MAKILFVEDDQFLREVYLDIFKSANIPVEVAVDGEEAYNKIKAGGWDLVLLDVVLPKISGTDIIKKLTSTAPIITYTKKLFFLTNIGDVDDLNEMSTLSDGYIIKSDLGPEEFVNKVRSNVPGL